MTAVTDSIQERDLLEKLGEKLLLETRASSLYSRTVQHGQNNWTLQNTVPAIFEEFKKQL
jgi:hypothetical protein